MEVIKNCLEKFSKMSGQKVNFHKSNTYFSPYVDEGKTSKIVALAGIPRAMDLGRYLGTPSIHGRMKMSLFSEVLEHINARLNGWRAKQLSFSGRVVLAQSVLSAIPYHFMQTNLFPKGICKEIERIIRRFIWKGSGNKNQGGIHLVKSLKWDKITRPKQEGGLGIRNLEGMNLAFLAKLGWCLVTKKDNEWAKVIISKYMHDNTDLSKLTNKRNASHIWQGMVKGTTILAKGAKRYVNNAHDTKFWLDKWCENFPLLEVAQKHITNPNLQASVAEYWDRDRGWKWQKIKGIIPPESCNKLYSKMLRQGPNNKDRISRDVDDYGFFYCKLSL